MVFLMSDFLDEIPQRSFSILSKKHDVIAIMTREKYEYALPQVGFLSIVDSESGEELLIDTRSCNNAALAHCLLESAQTRRHELAIYGASVMTITNDRPFINEIVTFFRRRLDGW